MTRPLRTSSLCAGLLLLAAAASAQPRRGPRQPPPPPTPAPTPTFDPGETIAVPVTSVDGMLRRMKVWLFTAPPGSQAFGAAALGQGQTLWALLPSCRPTNPDDNRDPCPVDRISIEAVGRGNASITSPTTLSPAPDARRVQAAVVQGADRVRIRVVGRDARVRYEAVVEAERLGDLPAPSGAPSAGGFEFDLTQYPSR